jgi:hypothetical protein
MPLDVSRRPITGRGSFETSRLRERSAAMKKTLLFLAILVLISSPSMAGRNARGAMVVHTDDAIGFSAGWDYCAQNPPPGNLCDMLVPTSNRPVEETETIVWLIGAWLPTWSPCVTAFQFGVYHNLPSGQGYFVGHGPCGPDALEIPDPTFPEESGTGVAVAYGTRVYPAFVLKMYWLAIVGVDGGEFSTGPYPNINPPRAQFADDSSPPVIDDCYRFGTLRWAPDWGVNNCPVFDDPWACCFPDCHCEILFLDDCVRAGGEFQGAGSLCLDDPCHCPVGACCFVLGDCSLLNAADCALQGGRYLGDLTVCEPNPCMPTPTLNTTWGRIKSTFR